MTEEHIQCIDNNVMKKSTLGLIATESALGSSLESGDLGKKNKKIKRGKKTGHRTSDGTAPSRPLVSIFAVYGSPAY